MIDTKALRSRILDLAIQGKLTEQLESDDSIDKLLEELSDEKKELISAKIIKNKKIKPIDKTEIPFDIPPTWRLVYIDDIAFVTKLAGFEYTDTIAPNLSQNGIPLFKGKNIQDGKIILEFESYIPQTISDELPRSQVLKKCLLTPYVGTIGNIAIFDGSFNAHLGSNVGKIELLNNRATHVIEEYILYYLRSSIGNKQLSKFKKATAQDSISIEAIRNTIVVLPPLAEQKRIVERVEEIFRLLDTIDKAQEKYSADSQILKAKLITAGIQGKLTKQLESDGTAHELYQQIQEEKQKLIKEGKIKKEKPLPPISPDEIPFEIPQNWMWVRLKEISFKITDGTHHSPINTKNGDYMYVTAKNIKDKGVDLSNITYVTKEVHNEIYARCNPELNDILLIKDGATTGVVTVNNIDEPFSLLSSVALVKPVNKLIEPWYIAYVLRSSLFYKTIRTQMTGTGITRIVLRQIEPFIVPLPPLAEQKRIADVLERVLGVVE